MNRHEISPRYSCSDSRRWCLDPGSRCESAAVAKKLTGTAKAAFVQKCEFDAKAMLMSTSTLAEKDKKSYVAPTSSYGGCEGAASDL